MGIISFLTNCEFASSNSKTKAKYLQMLRSGFQGEEHYLLKWQQAPLVCPSQEVAVSITPKNPLGIHLFLHPHERESTE